TVRNNGVLPSSGQGIFINPTVAVQASLNNVRLENNIAGLKAQGSSTTMVSFSVAAGNVFAGFSASASPAVLNIERSISVGNGTGVVCAAGTTVRVGNSGISGNGSAVTAGACFSFKNNDIDVLVSINPLNPQ